jgi:hypothetical protein
MSKRQGKEAPGLDLAYKGMIPWSTKEFYEVYAKCDGKKMKKGNKPVDQELLMAEVFQEEYPNEIEFKAHLYRLRLIRIFIFKHGRQMIQDGFGAPEGQPGLRNELMDILCTLPYSKKEKGFDGEDFYTFSYPEVKVATLKKINAHLN